MKKLRKLISALSEKDVTAIKGSFYRPSDKMALLFEMILNNEKDADIREKLLLGTNAFTTLGSRLKTKIQNHLIELSDSPREDIINKLITIDTVVFNSDRTIALATLRKMERELIRYDLSHELTIVYRNLKKLHINKPEYLHYSKLYNRHVAYSLALEKAEDLLGRYFIEFGYFFVMGDAQRLIALKAIYEELQNVCGLYKSHRMALYLAMLEIMHRLYVDDAPIEKKQGLPIEDIFIQIESVFKRYPGDLVYENLKSLVQILRFEYYFKYLIYDKAIQILGQFLEDIPHAILHYENYGFPVKVLHNLLLLRQNEGVQSAKLLHYTFPEDIDLDGVSTPAKVIIQVYRTIDHFNNNRLDQASKSLYALTNDVSFKEYGPLLAEIKCINAIIKFYQGDYVLFRQNLVSIQRLIRKNQNSSPEHVIVFVKLLTILNSKSKRNQEHKIDMQLRKLNKIKASGYKPVLCLNYTKEELLRRIN
jgi:hypothetical protein